MKISADSPECAGAMMQLLRVIGVRSFVALLVLLVLLPGAAAAQGVTHTVRPGDTLNSIAAAYGTTSTAIARANSLTKTRTISK